MKRPERKEPYKVAFVYTDNSQAFESAAYLTPDQAEEIRLWLHQRQAEGDITDAYVDTFAEFEPHASKAALMRELKPALNT